LSQNIISISAYLDEIIAKYDNEKVFSLSDYSIPNVSGITLQKFNNYIFNKKFAEFNFIDNVIENNSDSALKENFSSEFEINEIFTIKLISERMLFKFANVIKDLIECQNISSKICLESLNGFLAIENDEIILYTIYRYMARDGKHNLYEGKSFILFLETVNDFKSGDNANKKLETMKIISVKTMETKFAPLYYKRITYKLNKDTKSFNFPVYFALVNLLYSKQLYQPCITLLFLIIQEISSNSYELYKEAKTNQNTECFLHLYEFLLFKLVYMLIKIKNFDRALYELLQITEPINEMNKFIYKLLLGLCQSQCLYYELAIYTLSDAFYQIKPFVESYNIDEEVQDEGGEKLRKVEELNEAPEGIFMFLLSLSYGDGNVQSFYSGFDNWDNGTIF
jgi:hypothetical protein